MMGVKTVVMVVVLLPLLTNAANIFTAFSRGFERQEKIQSTLKETGSGWVSREVPGKVWVCTGQPRSSPEAKVSSGDQLSAFLRLFAYLDGKNSRDEKLPMGKPVSIEAKASEEGVALELNACFFLPERVQADPPTPTDPLVYLSQRPSITVYTRKFGGFASDEDTWMSEAKRLRKVLTDQGIETRTDVQYWNAYDPPHKFWRRRNEVWLVEV